jgi:predicted metalloendopeptidase
MVYAILSIGALFVLAAWDVARRALVQYEAHRALRERIDELERMVQKEHETVQRVLEKLNAATAAVSMRGPRNLQVQRG